MILELADAARTPSAPWRPCRNRVRVSPIQRSTRVYRRPASWWIGSPYEVWSRKVTIAPPSSAALIRPLGHLRGAGRCRTSRRPPM